MPFRKKAPARSSISKLQSQIDEIRAGRASWLDLSDYTLDERLTELPDEIRGLEGLRRLYIGENEIYILPPWLGDLPDLEEIDTSDHPMTARQQLPHIR